MPTTRTGAARWLAIATATVTASCVLAACGSSTSTDSTSSADSAGVEHAKAQLAKYTGEVNTPPTESEPIEGGIASLKGKTVFYIPIGLKVSYFQDIQNGMKEAFEAAGVNLRSCDGQFTPSGIAGCINQAIGEKADAVVTNSIPYELAGTAYEALVDAGIPVYLSGAPTPDGKSNTDAMSFGSSDPTLHTVARLAADAIIADSGGTAKVLYVKVIDSEALSSAADAGIAEFKEYCPGCRVTVKTTNTASLSQLPSAVSSALISDPDTNYVLPQTDAQVSATLQGAQNSGFINKVKGATSNGDLSGLQLLESKKVLIADVGYSANYLGWVNADAAVRMLAGKPVPEAHQAIIRVFTADNIGDLKLDAATSQTNEWYGSDDFKDDFTNAWAGK